MKWFVRGSIPIAAILAQDQPDAIDQISARMLAGLVLIISARGFGDETDHDTDFIVLTQNRHTRYPSGVIGLGLRRLRTGFCSAALRNFVMPRRLDGPHSSRGSRLPRAP